MKKSSSKSTSHKSGSAKNSGVKSKVSALRHVISKVGRLVRHPKKKDSGKISVPGIARKVAHTAVQDEKEQIETTKFAVAQEYRPQQAVMEEPQYRLPVRYGDNRIVLLPRDPWWLHSYWDITEGRINEVIASIPVYERENMHWVIRVYDVSDVANFNGNNANSFFDIDIHFEASNWYINVQQPERSWCVEIGLKNPAGKFFMVARSNIIKSPFFGISSVIDEEWAIPDEEYYKLFGHYDLGRSSMERKQKFEEIMLKQISSPLGSWGGSFMGKAEEDQFFLEVWTELILYGRTHADADVKVQGRKIKLRPDGTFTLRYNLPVGDYTLDVTAQSANKKHFRKKVPAVKRFDKKD